MGWTSSSSTRSKRWRSSRNSRTAARNCSDCSSGSGTSARQLSFSQKPRRRRRTSDSRLRNRGGTRRSSRTGSSSSRCTRLRESRSSVGSGFRRCAARTTRRDSPSSVAVSAVEPEVEDHSDVMAAAVDGIRAKAQGEGHRFKPYVRSSDRKAPTPAAKQEAAKHLQDAVALLRETRFEDSIDPLLKAIARDDEDRRSWILLAEAYLRLGRPYKSAVGDLRALELSPKNEQAGVGLRRGLGVRRGGPTASPPPDRAPPSPPPHPPNP